MNINEHLLTMQDVADFLKVSVLTVRGWARSGYLPTVRVGRYKRMSKSMLNDWLNPSSSPEISPGQQYGKLTDTMHTDHPVGDPYIYKKPFHIFLEEECIVEINSSIESTLLREAYKKYCEERGYKVMSENTLGQELKRLGHERKRIRRDGIRVYIYEGVRLLRDDVPAPIEETQLVEEEIKETIADPAEVKIEEPVTADGVKEGTSSEYSQGILDRMQYLKMPQLPD